MSLEFDNNVLDLVKQKVFYPYEYINGFQKPSKEKFYSSLTDRKISDKEHEYVLNVWKKTWNENDEIFKMWRFIISWCIWKL